MGDTQTNVEEGHELSPIREDHWKALFNKYDINGDGKISIHELKRILSSREYERDLPEKLEYTIHQLSDTNGDGFLDYDEFVQMITNPRFKYLFGHFVHRYVDSVIPKRRGHKPSSDVPDGQYEDEYSVWPPPVWMVLISLIEIVLFCIDEFQGDTSSATGPIATAFIFDPKKRNEAWRFITYMFVHIGYLHLVVNLAVQLLLGVPLEMVHKGWRVLIIYFAGVLAGSLGTSITDPYVKLAGASGGVYALITAHIASVIMNWKEMQMAAVQLFIFLVITGVDFGQAVYSRYWLEINDHIGYVAHLAGAIAGLLVGIFVLRNLEEKSCEKKLWWVSLVTFCILLSIAVIWNIAYPSYFVEVP